MLFIDDLPELKDTKSGQELIQYGHDQGKLEGKLEGTRMALCCQLEAKFGAVPALVQQRIDEITTVEKLTHLLRQVLKVDSYDQFDWS